MVIDLGALRSVEIRPDAVAVVAGGATASDLLDAARPHGLGAALGTVGSVGVVGLTLGGGLSPLSGVTGLAVDNLLAAEVVLPDARVVRADAESEPELFWALRGGGGNFGVVTRVEVRLHPIPEVTTGLVVFSWDRARDVLRAWHAVAAVDDALDVMFGAQATPEGPVLYMVPLWTGDADDGAAHIHRVRDLGDPVLDSVARIALADSVHALDAAFPIGSRCHLASRTLPADLDAAAVDAFLTAAETMPVGCWLNVHHLHGAITRVPVADTAYAYREEHVVVELLGCWTDGDGRAARDWVAHAERLLDPHALPGGWPNLMAPDDSRAQEAYGPNTERLLAAKRHYDPDGVFQGTPLPR
jgi:FAD/FMN-containing dehydrogenase